MSTICVYTIEKHNAIFRECVVVLNILNLLRYYKLKFGTCHVYLLIYHSHTLSILWSMVKHMAHLHDWKHFSCSAIEK